MTTLGIENGELRIESPKVDKLFIAPGNAGTALVGTNVDIKADDFAAIKDFALANQVNMVVVGPEDPLVKGVYDYFKKDEALSSIPVIGPSGEGAQGRLCVLGISFRSLCIESGWIGCR